MFNLLAQTYPIDTSLKTSSGFVIFGAFSLLIWLAVVVVAIVALWKVFEKAGVDGWKAIIPIYNSWILAEIAGKPGWWGLAPLVYLIPVIGFMLGWIVVLIVYVIISLELAKRFGKDTLFAILGLVIFSLIGLLILGFGDAKYSGTPYKTIDQQGDSKSNNKPKSKVKS